MKNLKYVFYAALATLILGAGPVLGQNTPDQAAAQQQAMFEKTAEILGISIDDVKNGWADGKTVSQIAQEHGISQQQLQQRMRDLSLQQSKDDIQILVDEGVISQEQANRRMQAMENRMQDGGGGWWRSGCGGMMGGNCPMQEEEYERD